MATVTIQIGDREVKYVKTLSGTPSEREESSHAVGRDVGRVLSEAALNELADALQHPCCCGRPMENRGRSAVTVQGLDGPQRTCERELSPADGLLEMGRHRITRPLAKRVCQLAAIEHFPRLPQRVFDQHSVRLSHNEIVPRGHDCRGAFESQRRAEVQAWENSTDKHWPTPETTPRRVYISCDGIMDCANEREPHPDDPDRQRLKWQQMRVCSVYWQDERERWYKQVVWGREDISAFGASLDRVACRCRGRDTQSDLRDAVTAHFQNHPAPRLIINN